MMRGLALTAVLLVALVGGAALLLSFGPPAAPEQPIAFSHKLHAGDNRIACQYCHVSARHASVAGIPSVQRCLGCHKITAAARPEVQKLAGYWERKEPIPWRKVTWMPDFVFFEHWPHVRAGLECQTCHGAVETMDRMPRLATLTMDVCVACHRERNASIDCATCHR